MKSTNISAKKGFSLPGGARTLALVILVVAASVSFALGFFVGRATVPRHKVVREAKVPPAAPAANQSARPAQPTPGPAPVSATPPAARQRSAVSSDPLVVDTLPKAAPPRRIVKKSSSREPVPQKASSRSLYSVQVGAYETLVDAEKVRKGFLDKGYDSFVLRVGDQGGKAVFKVRVGEFPDRNAAALLSLKIKSIEGIKAFVVKGD